MLMSEKITYTRMEAYGIDEVNSAKDAATQSTKKQGISHPKTIPICPAIIDDQSKRSYSSTN
jgi:hypothetical protein